jgi:hypothetical protein
MKKLLSQIKTIPYKKLKLFLYVGFIICSLGLLFNVTIMVIGSLITGLTLILLGIRNTQLEIESIEINDSKNNDVTQYIQVQVLEKLTSNIFHSFRKSFKEFESNIKDTDEFNSQSFNKDQLHFFSMFLVSTCYLINSRKNNPQKDMNLIDAYTSKYLTHLLEESNFDDFEEMLTMYQSLYEFWNESFINYLQDVRNHDFVDRFSNVVFNKDNVAIRLYFSRVISLYWVELTKDIKSKF